MRYLPGEKASHGAAGFRAFEVRIGMGEEMSWAVSAYRALNDAYMGQISAGITDKKAILDALDAAYPFGERKYFPYKVWLRERRSFAIAKGLPIKRTKREQDLLDMIESMKGEKK